MKIRYVMLASAFLISGVAFAQKDELKTLKKIYDKDAPSAKDVAEYKSTVAKAEPLVANSTESDQVYFGFYKSMIPFVEMNEAMAKPENAKNPQGALKYFTPASIASLAQSSEKVIEFEKKSGKQVYTKEIEQMSSQFKPMILNYAIGLGEQKRFSDASSVLNSIYILDKKDPEKLYFAASYALNAQDYDTSLKYYEELKKLNFSGEKTNYFAKSKLTDNEDFFDSKTSRDNAVKVGSHSTPRDEKEPSKRGEIYKNVALILVQQGKTDEAKKQIIEARAANPNDVSLMLTEADLYLKSNDLANYKRIISQVIEKTPNDPNMFYNLGVISAQANENVEAEKYYKKAFELDPNYINAYLNLAILKLDSDTAIVEEMNKLGNTPKDNKRYDELKAKREGLFKSTLPYLEKANQLDAKNEDVARTLLNVYNYLEMTSEAKALKAKSGL